LFLAVLLIGQSINLGVRLIMQQYQSFMAGSLLALFTHTANASGGFLVSEQIATLPQEILLGAQAVFRVATPTDTATPFSAMSLEESEDFLKYRCGENIASLDQARNCSFIQQCIDQGGFDSRSFAHTSTMPQKQICYRYYSGGGSINLVGRDGDYAYMLTAWHVVQSYHRYSLQFLGQALVSWTQQERLSTFKNMRTAFDLFDAQGGRLMSVTPSDIEEIVMIGDLKGPSVHPGTDLEALGNVLEDIVILKIKDFGLLGQPMKIASNIPKASESIYAVGYPIKTYNRAINADGFTQAISIGSVKSMKEIIAKEVESKRAKALGDERYDLPTDREIIRTDADLVSGNSGGAFLNAEGEIFGIVISSFSNPDRYSFKGGIGISINQILDQLGLTKH
jgi:hypothetical protein